MDLRVCEANRAPIVTPSAQWPQKIKELPSTHSLGIFCQKENGQKQNGSAVARQGYLSVTIAYPYLALRKSSYKMEASHSGPRLPGQTTPTSHTFSASAPSQFPETLLTRGQGLIPSSTLSK